MKTLIYKRKVFLYRKAYDLVTLYSSPPTARMPKASDLDLAVSSVIMSKCYTVKGPTLSKEILYVRGRDGGGRDNTVPLMLSFDINRKKEIQGKRKGGK